MFDGLEMTPNRAVSSLLSAGALHVYPLTAVRSDFRRQNFSTFPKRWYVDATFRCRRCGDEFLFSGQEQQLWYERRRFHVDSVPRECPSCRHVLRELKALKQEYDRDVSLACGRGAGVERKERLIRVIDKLATGGVTVTSKVGAVRRMLVAQVERLRREHAA